MYGSDENSLEDDDLVDYSQRLATSWGIGEKGKNNGALIYVAINDRKIRIHTGYGMEATLTDALTKRIIEQVIKPNFRTGDYYAGLDEATNVMMRAASGEYVNDRKPAEDNLRDIFKIIVIIAVILYFIISSIRGTGGFGGALLRGGGGTFGRGGFSGGGFSSGRSGGFGGFGGGGFGGGGSSGSW